MLRKLIIVLFALLLTFLLLPVSFVYAEEEESHSFAQTMSVSAKPIDKRALVLKDYLDKYNSPLADHAQDFIDAADTYDMDWKLVPAISGVESTFGKHTPGSIEYPSYNGWGWGVYGDNSLGFKSWRDGIFTVSKGLKENYINKGLTDPYSMNRVYASSPTWGIRVAHFINDISEYEKNYNYTTELAFVNQSSNLPITADLATVRANSTHQTSLNFIN